MPTFEEVQSFLSDNLEDEKVKGYIGGLGIVTPDGVSKFLESEEGKKILQPRLDKYHSKGLDTWKQNNLPKIIDDEITKRNPAETPEQKRLRKIEEENHALQKDIKKSRVKDQLIAKATADKIPLSLVDFAVSDDENVAIEKYNSIKDAFANEIEKTVKSLLGEKGRRLTKPEDKAKGFSMDDFIRSQAGVQSA